MTEKQKALLLERRGKAEKLYLDSGLEGRYLDRKIDDNTFINFASLILDNTAENTEYNIPKIRNSLAVMKDGQKIEIAGFEITVLHTPGHTPGGCCYYIPSEKVLFSGDTLFRLSMGRTDMPGGSTRQLFASLRRLGGMARDLRVFPGHGDVTTLDFEQRHNFYLRSDKYEKC